MKFLNDVILTGAGADLTAPATVTFSGLSVTTETSAVVVNSSGVLSKRALGTSAFTNTYTLPKATATVRGGTELRSNTVQTVTANNVSSSAGRTYGVQLNSADQMVVNVPWTSLTKASTTVLGGIIVGNGLSVNATGVLSVPTASDTEDGKMLSADKTKLDTITVSNIVLKDATETISGAKTFSNTIIGDVNGNSATTSERTITSGEISAISANTSKTSNIVQTSVTGNAGTATALTSGNKSILGSLTLTSASDGILNLRQSDAGSTAGTKEGGWNYIQFQDGQGDRQAYFGIDSTGNLLFAPEVASKKVKTNTGLIVNGDLDANNLALSAGSIVLSGTGRIQGIDTVTLGTDAANKTYVDTAETDAIASAASANKAWSTITGTPTTIAAYGITDALVIGTTGTTALAGNTTIPAAEAYTAHENITAATSVNGSGRTYIQDITVDSNGHVTGIATASETVTDTTYTVGNGGLTQNNFTNALKTSYDGAATHAASAHAPSTAQANRAISDSVTSTSTTTAASSAAVKAAKDTANTAGLLATAALSKGGGDMTGAIDMNSNKITELGTPSAGTDAATKAYVDSAVIADTDTQDITQSGNTFTLERGGSVDVSTTTAVAANSLKLGMVLANSVTSTSTIQAGSANATRLAYNNVSTTVLQTRLSEVSSGNIALGANAGIPTIATGTLTANGTLYAGASRIGLRSLEWSGANAEDAMVSIQGDVIYHPETISTTAGRIYMLTSTGGLTLADADTANTSTGLLVIALANLAGKGLLLRGVLRLPTNPDASPGQPIYLNADGESVPSGTATAGAPTAGIVRVLGYQLTNSGGTSSIYFNPDNTWVELTA